MNKITLFFASVAALAATGCTSYEIDMPENPEPPTVGREVSTNVLYQANPRFYGDNECLKSLTAQLDRIDEIDCDVLWVMPVFEPGELNAIGSPYCVRNFTALNPRYGTMDDMKELVNKAHAKGMKVILDWIANHTAWDCAWITEHPDWYVHDAEGNIVAANGWTDVAQLDFSNQQLRQAMKDAMLYWVNQLAIDGFRCDYAEGVPTDFWAEAIKDIRAIDSKAIMLAETSKTEFYECGFDMIYDWNSSTAISAAFKGGKASDVVKEGKDALAKVPAGKSILRYVFNHDVAAENNVATMYGAPEAIPAAYVCAAMINGTPMIYDTMDIEGLSGKISFFDYSTKTFSPTLTAEYHAINAAFKASAEVRRGVLEDFSTSSVVCFKRSIPGHDLLVAVNTTAEVQPVKTPIQLAGTSMTNLIDGNSSVAPVEIELQPYGYTILMK